MFDDKRSKRVVLVAHCVLNQNAKLDACAFYAGAIREVAHLLVESGVGIVQLPCPELLCLGLDRDADREARSTVAAEDTRIALRMAEPSALRRCEALVEDAVHQVREYRRNAFEVVGLVGIDGSPSCGVETTWADGAECSGRGLFVARLSEALARGASAVRAVGIRASAPERAVALVRELIGD